MMNCCSIMEIRQIDNQLATPRHLQKKKKKKKSDRQDELSAVQLIKEDQESLGSCKWTDFWSTFA